MNEKISWTELTQGTRHGFTAKSRNKKATQTMMCSGTEKLVLVNFMEHCVAITAAWLFNVTTGNLEQAKKNVVIGHFPSSWHCWGVRWTLIKSSSTVLNYKSFIPYSPGLAPCDFHIFPHMKWSIGGQHFVIDNELQTGLMNRLKAEAAAFYDERIWKTWCHATRNVSYRVTTA